VEKPSALTTQQEQIREIAEKIHGLTVKQQAMCVFAAAEKVVPLWEQWETRMGLPKLARKMILALSSWLEGRALSSEATLYGEELEKVLPEDLPSETDPTPGMAGWALRSVPIVALEACSENHEDILWTIIFYAAAAACNTGRVPVALKFNSLSGCEATFILQWWKECCERLVSEDLAKPVAETSAEGCDS
jgi:hypothetical protein